MIDVSEETKPLAGRRALLLGESGAQRILLTALNEAGCTVHVRSRDESALAALSNTPIDLILLDFSSPRHAGLTLALKLRHSESHPPIVAFGWPEARSLAQMAGAAVFLELPLLQREFEASLSALCREHHFMLPASSLNAAACDTLLEALLEEIDEVRGQSDVHQTQIERMLNLKHDLLHAIAYELAAPFTPVAGYLQILQSERLGALNDQQKKVLDSIAQSSSRMVRTIDAITEFASLERSDPWVGAEKILLRPLLEKVIDVVRFSLAKPKHVLLRLIVHGEPESIVSDARRLGQLFRALIETAVVRSPSGASVLMVLLCDSERLRLSIYDQGAPPSADERARMIDPFLPRPHSERFAFTELELPIAHKLAKMLGGRLLLEAPPQKQPDPRSRFLGLCQSLELPRFHSPSQGGERKEEQLSNPSTSQPKEGSDK